VKHITGYETVLLTQDDINRDYKKLIVEEEQKKMAKHRL
jgi:hypothetical protein